MVVVTLRLHYHLYCAIDGDLCGEIEHHAPWEGGTGDGELLTVDRILLLLRMRMGIGHSFVIVG